MDQVSAVLVDDLGPAKVIEIREPSIGLDAVLVIDNVACGPAIGGLRMAPDVTIAECARLARAMTLKNAAAGLPHGGGKSVLKGDPRMPRDRKERLIRGFAHALRGETDYLFGPDMGTDENAMAWVRDEIGRAVGLPVELGGIPLDELGATAWGLLACAEVAAPAVGIELKEARVAIQGYGAVGRHAARFFAAHGARIVAVSDSRGAVADAAGLDLAALEAAQAGGAGVAGIARGSKGGPEAIIDVECDIWIPAARPDVIRIENQSRLTAKLMLQGANIPVTDEAERALSARGVLVIPDFIANAGGVICAAMEYHGATAKLAFDAIAERIRANTAAVIERMRAGRVTPREAATTLARERVRRAMANRRWGIL